MSLDLGVQSSANLSRFDKDLTGHFLFFVVFSFYCMAVGHNYRHPLHVVLQIPGKSRSDIESLMRPSRSQS